MVLSATILVSGVDSKHFYGIPKFAKTRRFIQ